MSRPYASVLSGARGRVIAALVATGEPVTVRALARAAGTSPQGTLDVVEDLAAAGIVSLGRAGRARLASLNTDHLASNALVDLVDLRHRLIATLRAHLKTWEGLHAAWLFGSAARGDGDLSSDIDLLLVADDTDDPTWEEQTDELRDRVAAWTGNAAEILDYDRPSFQRLVTRKNRLVTEIREDGIPLTDRAKARRLLRKAA